MARKMLDDAVWVRMAASTEKYRPTLMAMHAEDGLIVATDGHRLHAAVGASGAVLSGFEAGEFLSTGERLHGSSYPSVRFVMPEAAKLTLLYRVTDVEEFDALLAAGSAYHKTHRTDATAGPRETTLPSSGGPVHVNPAYLAEVMRGMELPTLPTYIGVQGPLAPVVVVCKWRYALVMPVRCALETDHARFSLDACLRPAAEFTLGVDEATRWIDAVQPGARPATRRRSKRTAA